MTNPVPVTTFGAISEYCCMSVDGGCPHLVEHHEAATGRCVVGFNCPCTKLRKHREGCPHWPGGEVTE